MASDRARWLPLAVAVAMSSGCSFAPPLDVPTVAPTVDRFKETETAPWIKARPADALPREAWWTLYGDAELDALQQRLLANSPDIAAALARYRQAVAYNARIRAALFPTVDAVADAQRDRQSAQKPLRGATSPDLYDDFSLGVQVDYEVDLWGRIRNQVASATASEQAAQADLESARLSLQALLVDDYVQLRGLDRENALLDETVAAYAKALAMMRARGVRP
jgi:outer membrane protein TolC